LLLGLVAFAGALGGGFVYDDLKQIVRNEFIQENRYFWKAMTSDVWAFEGAHGGHRTGYWRPFFVLWLIVNERLFGTTSPAGWHVSSLLAHLGAVAACWHLLLRRLRLEPVAAGVVLALFAIHPVHVESVAWISGVTDPLATLLVLSAWTCHLSGRKALRYVALGLFALALLTKEFTVVLPVLVFAGAWLLPPRRSPGEAAREAAPYAFVTVLFLIARLVVLGGGGPSGFPGQATPVEVVLSLPAVAAFYLGEAVFPVRLSPMHTLRAVGPEAIGLANFWLPLAVVAAASWGAWRAVRRDAVRQLGLLLFLLPLLPAMKIDAFMPEQIVQDRYLYLPILGLLLVVVPLVSQGLARWLGAARGTRVLALSGMGLAVLLGLETASYGHAWGDPASFWERAVRGDPRSTIALVGQATVLRDSGRAPEALQAVERALAISPAVKAYELRGQLLVDLGRPEEGEKDLLLAAGADRVSAAPYERLAIAYQNQGRLDQAERILRLGREQLPDRFASLTDSLAVVLYLQGRKPEALKELEAVRERALVETGSLGAKVLLHLGSLHAEAGRVAEARAELEEFLRRTERLQAEPQVVEDRGQARKILAGLPRAGS